MYRGGRGGPPFKEIFLKNTDIFSASLNDNSRQLDLNLGIIGSSWKVDLHNMTEISFSLPKKKVFSQYKTFLLFEITGKYPPCGGNTASLEEVIKKTHIDILWSGWPWALTWFFWCVFNLRIWLYVFWNDIYTRKKCNFHPTIKSSIPPFTAAQGTPVPPDDHLQPQKGH